MKMTSVSVWPTLLQSMPPASWPVTKVTSCGVIAMRERNAACRPRCRAASHAGHYFVRDAGVGKRLDLFAAAAEDKRIATLEPNDVETAPRALDHHVADLFLRKRVDRFLLADVDPLAMFGREVEQGFVREMIVEDGVGDGEKLAALPGDQVRVARVRRRPGRPCS